MHVTDTLKSGLDTISKPFVFSAKLGYRGVETFVESTQPRNKWILGACVVAGIWAHRMAEVYAPQILCSIVVAHTVSHMKIPIFANFFAYTVVAPGIVPTLVPIVAYIAAAVAAYLFVLGGNGACRLIFGKSSELKTSEEAKGGQDKSSMV